MAPPSSPTTDEALEDLDPHRGRFRVKGAPPLTAANLVERAERGLRDRDALPAREYEEWRSRQSRLLSYLPDILHALAKHRIEPADAKTLDKALQRVHRPELLIDIERAELAEILAKFSPDTPGLAALEKEVTAPIDDFMIRGELGERAEQVKDFVKRPRVLRKLVLLEDRARLIDLSLELFEALSMPPREMRTRMAEIRRRVEELEPARAPILTTQLVLWRWRVSWAAELPVRVLLLRAALAVAARHECPEKLPLELDDPFAPGQKLRWRRESARKGTIWSVGPDGVDDGGVRTRLWDAHGFDVVLELELPE